MKCVEYLIEKLKSFGVRDVFGVPGGVVLDFMYAVERSKGIDIHLSYNEQAAGFEAIGYAQRGDCLGAAYATRGPGFTNLITSIAEAYQESVPIVFITSHSSVLPCDLSVRMHEDQEIDSISLVESITKFVARIDDVFCFKDQIDKACLESVAGRKGPVVLDIKSDLFNKELYFETSNNEEQCSYTSVLHAIDSIPIAREAIENALRHSLRPVFLLGDGARNPYVVLSIRELSEQLDIPILTSRGAVDILNESTYQFGYVGSHGLRQANFILSKADLILALGNRMSFPLNSSSFLPIFDNAKVIRIDIDSGELARDIPNSLSFCLPVETLFDGWSFPYDLPRFHSWITICEQIRYSLGSADQSQPIEIIIKLLKVFKEMETIVGDVGNNEFWLSKAYSISSLSSRLLLSRSFGTLGSALPKAIGAYYSTRMPVLCFVGDQGFQFNIQELQVLKSEKIPIAIIVLNNHSSGMIKDHQRNRYDQKLLHTNLASGYGCPSLNEIAKAYDIGYCRYSMNLTDHEFEQRVSNGLSMPLIIEIEIDETIGIGVWLKKGDPIQNLSPSIDGKLYDFLCNL